MFLEQAVAYKNPFWTYLLGSFVIIIFTFIGQLPLTFFLTGEALAASGGDPMLALRNLDKNLQLFLLLIPFVIGFLGLLLVVKKLNERSLLSISSSRKALDWQRILFAFMIWGGVSVVLILGDYVISPEDYQCNFNPQAFAILLVIGLALIPIQTSLEEYIFRGYLMQGFGTLFRNCWAPLVMTSLIFGSLHIFNPEVEKLGYGLLVYYIGTGLFLGILTLMDQGIELAVGFHAANNLLTALLVTSSWTAFQTESILIDVSKPSLGGEILISLLFLYPLFLVLMSRKYQWSDWKKNLIDRF